MLKRPEVGALGGVILVFIFFYVMAPPFRQLAAFTTILYQSATLGIPAVAVALLMIGGEFDLSAGVAVTASSLAAAIFATEVFGNVWIGVLAALVLSLGIGALNGYLLVKTKSQLSGDAVDFPDALRPQHRYHQASDRKCRD